MASGIVRAAISQLFDEESSFTYTERGKTVAELCRKITDSVIQESNVELFDGFCQELLTAIKKCMPSTTNSKSIAVLRQKAQMQFHNCRMSTLPRIWSMFSTAIGLEVDEPLVMQSVNQHIFDTLLVEHFQAQERPSSSTEVCTQLTAEEENILRYASGFIPFKLLNRYLKQSTEKASQFVECLSNMAVGGNETSFHHYTTEWIRKVNRGGLFCINDDAYKLFYKIEQKVRTRLPQQLKSRDGCKEELIKTVASNDEVQFMWSMLSVDIDDSFSYELLDDIIKLWVTIRGFSTVSAWMEEYKQTTKTNTQKSKGLRKTLSQVPITEED